VERVCENRIPLACQLKMGRPLRVEGETLVVGFGNDLHDLQLDRLKKVAVAGVLDEGLKALFHAAVRLRFERLSPEETEKLKPSSRPDDPCEEEVIRCLGAKRIA